MNQTPNIEDEKTGIEELDNLANIYGWHHEKCAGHSHFPSCPVVKLRRVLIKEQQTLHQQLQKAREEERERIASELDELMEQLADIEHDRWSKWQKYLHSKVIPSADDGISLIGTEFIDRWNRQIATPYSELSEAEKESDRQQVRPYLELIKRKIRNHSELDQLNK